MAQANSRRTPDELLNPALNYFIAFGISPMETDRAKIEVAIKKKASATGGSIETRRLIELKNDAIEVLCNDAVYDAGSDTYKPNAGARAKEASKAKEMKLEEASKALALLCKSKKTILKSEILNIFDTSNKGIQFFEQKEFDARIAKDLAGLGVKIVDNTDPEILFAEYKKSDDLLKALGNETLYDFLKLSDSASKAEISTALAASLANVSKISDLKKKQSYNNLNPLVDKVLLKNDNARKYYDYYVATRATIWEEFETRKKFGYRDIEMAEYEDYVQKIVSGFKATIEAAEKFIAAGCKFYNVTIIGKAEDSNLEFCPYEGCGKLNVAGAKVCAHCGRALEIICWNCGGKVPFAGGKACATCNATPQAKSLFDARVLDIEKIVHLPSCEVNDLRNALGNLKNVIPSYKTQPNSYACKKISDYEAAIEKKIKEEETTGESYKKDVAKIEEQIALKNYQQALNMAENMRRTYPTYNAANTTALINNINKVIAQATAFINQAKAYIAQNNVDLVISTASKALDVCADLSEARQILQKYPPAAPANVRAAVVSGNVVRIEWTKQGNQNMTTYTVVKKVGSKPANPTDGTVIEQNLSIDFLEDSNVVSATPYYYAVFAQRCDVRSAVTATVTPVRLFLDVSNVHQEVVENCVKVKWDTPHNVKAIEVWKKEGPVPPSGAGDGKKLPVKGLDGFTDDSAEGENSYLIICAYELNGSEYFSKGVSRAFKKFSILKKLSGVSITPQPTGEFLLKCDTPEDGKLGIVYSEERISCKYDTVIQMSDFNTVCKDCQKATIRYDSEGNTVFSIPEGIVAWAYPILSNDQLFTVSQPVLLNNIAGVKNVSFTMTGGNVTVKGTLDPAIKNVIFKVSTKAFAMSMTDDGDKLTVSRDSFLADGGAVIKLKADTLSYISVFAEIEKNGKTTYTRATTLGEEPIGNMKKTVVYYTIDAAITPGKRVPLTLKFSADSDIEIPVLSVMKGNPRPLSKNAGELVEKTQPVTLKKGLFSKSYTAKISLTVAPTPMNTKFVAFVDDDTKAYVQLKRVEKL